MYKYDIHESHTAAVITDDEGFVIAYLSAVENTTASRNLERMTKLLAKAEQLEQACQQALDLLQDPDASATDADRVEVLLMQALGVSHA